MLGKRCASMFCNAGILPAFRGAAGPPRPLNFGESANS